MRLQIASRIEQRPEHELDNFNRGSKTLCSPTEASRLFRSRMSALSHSKQLPMAVCFTESPYSFLNQLSTRFAQGFTVHALTSVIVRVSSTLQLDPTV